ncbi:MAG: hypothetical protein RLZZ210_1650 [Pseudomonadota bacterium]|jgi:hypothetical protein
MGINRKQSLTVNIFLQKNNKAKHVKQNPYSWL